VSTSVVKWIESLSNRGLLLLLYIREVRCLYGCFVYHILSYFCFYFAFIYTCIWLYVSSASD
jgi:hypothetical protein